MLKRYTDISYRLARITPLREDKEGEWVKLKDVKKSVRELLFVPNKTYNGSQIDIYVDMFYPKDQQEE